jgi:hypothetical protein
MDFDVKLDAFDKAIKHVRSLGANCFMSKIDIESAYRCIPVRPQDWPLLGLQWDGSFYFDVVMQFGVTSATAIFEWYSSAAQHIAEHACAIKHMVHYVDDFLLFAPTLSIAKDQLERLLRLFAALGIPVSLDKLEGPVNIIVFLGILFDTITMTIRLDEERLSAIHTELARWNELATASREEVQSLVGVLSFAAKVVPPGRTFLRRMIDHLKTIPSSAASTTQYPLSDAFRADLTWWRLFLTKWNGIGIVPDAEWTSADSLAIYTDACVSGYGAMFGSHWFACTWSAEEEQLAARTDRDSMPFKELYALTRAAATWADQWRGQKIMFHCDCQPMVDAWRKGDSTQPHISTLIRTLLFIAATHDFNMNVTHIEGKKNVCADLLSRGQVHLFLASPGQHDPLPTTPSPIPTLIW